MLLGSLLKLQQFIHDNKVAVKKTSECNHISVCMIAMAVSSFPPEPSYTSGKQYMLLVKKCNHVAKCMHDSYGSIFLSSKTYTLENNTCH